MEHAVLTRELINHAMIHRKDMCMVQIGLSNAFDRVPHEQILNIINAIGLPVAMVELVTNICIDNRSKITLTG
jgi:hypothetical protein